MTWAFCTLTTVINGRELKYDIESGEIWGQNYNLRGRPWEVKSVWKNDDYLKMKIGSKMYFLHRVIYKFYNPKWNIEDGSKDNFIDHINGHTDENQIENLRNLTHQQNGWNRTKAKGYSWCKDMKKWRAYINLNDKQIHLGLFDLEADARNAYLEAKKIYHIIIPI